MRPAIDLIRFVLGSTCPSDRQAIDLLERALVSETEPLDYFAIHARIGEKEAYARAARWCGLAFSDVVPRQVPANPAIAHMEALAEVKTLRARLFDRDVLFTSAGFRELLNIRSQLIKKPELGNSICIVPPRALRSGLTDRSAKRLLDQARTRLATRWPYASAHLDLTMRVRTIFSLGLAFLVLISAITPFVLKPVLVPVLAFLLLVPAALKLAASYLAVRNEEPLVVAPVSDDDLPVYTVLIPLRDEANMVPQLASAMHRLDYPEEKLDIKFVVESGSQPTLDAVMAVVDEMNFELIIVPDQAPRTKPKALNYALPLARGEFVVVYDAEDIPQSDQLRRAVSIFRDQPGLDVLQAELVIDNANENWLTALYCGEYSGLFGILLPALARWKMPMPLGGTSNHFRLQSLRETGGWDAFNVTEDADIGVRLTRLRYRTSTFSSRTYEEAPINLGAWLAQRTRWMKGWMQTFIVHNRYPLRFLKDIGWRNFLIFQAYVGGMIISAPLHTVFLGVLLERIFFGGGIGMIPGDPWSMAQLGILITGYGSAFVLSTMGLSRLGLGHLSAYQFLLPFYWILNSLAAILAVYELLRRPYFWAKTEHGVTRLVRGADLDHQN